MRAYGRNIAVAATCVALLGACGGTDFNQANGHSGTPVNSGGTTGSTAQATLIRVITATSDARTAHFTMTVSAAGENITALGGIDFAKPALSMSMTIPPAGTIDERLVGDNVYVHSDAFARLYGKPWVALDIKKMLGRSVSSLSQGQSDPSQYLEYLAGVSDDAHVVGTDTVRGVHTTHYRATIDMDRAIDRSDVPASVRERVRALLPLLKGVTMATDVWVDTQNRARKITINMPMDKLTQGATSGEATIAMEYFDFGAAVEVSAPPDDDVHTLSGIPGLGG